MCLQLFPWAQNHMEPYRLFANLWIVAHEAPVLGILQARILEWVSMLSSSGSPQPKDRTINSCVAYIAGRFFTTKSPGKPHQYTPSLQNSPPHTTEVAPNTSVD